MKIQKRTEQGKRVRSLSITPGVLYGKGMTSAPIQVDAQEFIKMYHSKGTSKSTCLCQLKLYRKRLQCIAGSDAHGSSVRHRLCRRYGLNAGTPQDGFNVPAWECLHVGRSDSRIIREWRTRSWAGWGGSHSCAGKTCPGTDLRDLMAAYQAVAVVVAVAVLVEDI